MGLGTLGDERREDQLEQGQEGSPRAVGFLWKHVSAQQHNLKRAKTTLVQSLIFREAPRRSRLF
jgi:hypothetical protein